MGDILSGAANIFTGSQTNKTNKEIAQMNLAFQRENLAYQKDIQQQIFGREDNAVQRRSEDLDKAGINRLMAGGQAANAGGVVQTEAPQNNYKQERIDVQMGEQELVNTAYDILTAKQNINMSKTQEDLIRAQTLAEVEKAPNIRADTEKKVEEAKGVIVDNTVKNYDYGMSRGWGLRSRDTLPKNAWELGTWAGLNTKNLATGKNGEKLEKPFTKGEQRPNTTPGNMTKYYPKTKGKK